MAEGDELTPAAPGSALADLRQRREKAKAKLHLDLVVPRLDPPVGIRFRPIHQREVDAVLASIRESKDPDRLVVGNATHLANACLGIFEIADGKPVGDPSTWPKFDAALAELLGVPQDTPPRALVQLLYLADGDIIGAAQELADWSGQTERLLAEETAGN